MICSQCGAQLNDGASFCTSCGAKQGAAAGAAPAPAQQAQYQQPVYQQPQAQQPYQQPQYQQPQYQAPQAQQAKSKVAAGLLAIFLGGWGIHKFYLGYGKEGGIMLGGWVLGMILIFAAGIGMLLISAICIIGIIEGIMYLTKSDEEFYRIYVAGNKPWF